MYNVCSIERLRMYNPSQYNQFMKIAKKILISVVVLLTAAVSGFVAWGSNPLPPMPEALNALQSTQQVNVRTSPWLEFAPATAKPSAALILYPGARVDPRAYAPTARAIAAQGYLVIVPAMPLNFAIFGGNIAGEIMAAHPEILHWALGGHSLGGVMASSYSKQHEDQIQGLVLLASYPAGSDDLSQSSLKVSSIFASQDGMATEAKIDSSRPLLPADTAWVEIIGGNHAQFGWYGEQPGDNPAEISHQSQQDQIVAAVIQLLSNLDKTQS
jgi:dienelactone hydrolase